MYSFIFIHIQKKIISILKGKIFNYGKINDDLQQKDIDYYKK